MVDRELGRASPSRLPHSSGHEQQLSVRSLGAPLCKRGCGSGIRKVLPSSVN